LKSPLFDNNKSPNDLDEFDNFEGGYSDKK
jgi:hypothetical protein